MKNMQKKNDKRKNEEKFSPQFFIFSYSSFYGLIGNPSPLHPSHFILTFPFIGCKEKGTIY
jgi:hypothetical protein